MKYPRHDPFCAAMPDFHPEGPCDCGLSNLMGLSAQAEALVEVIQQALKYFPSGWPTFPAEADWLQRAGKALARLPADALAERRALEGCERFVREFHLCSGAKGCRGCSVLAALDVARREGGG